MNKMIKDEFFTWPAQAISMFALLQCLTFVWVLFVTVEYIPNVWYTVPLTVTILTSSYYVGDYLYTNLLYRIFGGK